MDLHIRSIEETILDVVGNEVFTPHHVLPYEVSHINK